MKHLRTGLLLGRDYRHPLVQDLGHGDIRSSGRAGAPVGVGF